MDFYCEECQLCNGSRNFAPKHPLLFGRGCIDKPLLFVGQNPGAEEDDVGKVFVGPSGKLLINVIKDIGINEEIVHYTNVVKCRTLNNREPTTTEVKCCLPILLQELERLQPKVIVPLGSLACKALGGSAITQVRGTILETRSHIPMIPTYHPAYILRYPQHLKAFCDDIRVAYEVYQGRTFGQLPKYLVVKSQEDESVLSTYLNTDKVVAVDIETKTLDPFSNDAKILCIAFCHTKGTAVVVPLRHKDNPNVDTPHYHRCVEIIKAFLCDITKKKIFHNAMFDVEYLQHHICQEKSIVGVVGDTMIKHYLAVSEEEEHGLKSLALRYTDMGNYDKEVDSFLEGIPTTQRDYEKYIPYDTLLQYNGADTDATIKINSVFDEYIRQWNLSFTYSFVVELVMTLQEVEASGFKLDITEAQIQTLELEEQEKLLLQKLDAIPEVQQAKELRIRDYTMRGQPIPSWSYNSVQALRVLYFDVLHMPLQKETSKGNPCLDAEVLQCYVAEGDPVSSTLCEYRAIRKQLSMYSSDKVSSWLSDDGLVHPQFLPHVTVTGRLASRNPNFQNFPRDGKAKRMIVSRWEDGLVVEADYKQNELRGLAHYSKEPQLINAFLTNMDPHTEGAKQTFNYDDASWKELKVTNIEKAKHLRFLYKLIVFGVMYGRGAKSVAEDLWDAAGKPKGGPTQFEFDARSKIDLFFSKNKRVASWIDRQHARAMRDGFIRTRFGRVRRLDTIRSSDEGVVAEAMRQAVNTQLQTWSSDVTVIALMRIKKFLHIMKWPAIIFGTVHDSIVFDVRAPYLFETICVVHYIMSRPPRPLVVPLVPDFGVGSSWGEKQELDFSVGIEQWYNSKPEYLSLLEEITKDTFPIFDDEC